MKIQVAITLADFRVKHGVDEAVWPHNYGATTVALMAEAIEKDLEQDKIHPSAMKGMVELTTRLTAYAASRAAEGWPVEGVVSVSPWETHDEQFNRRCAAMRTEWDKISLEDMFSKDPATQTQSALRMMGLR